VGRALVVLKRPGEATVNDEELLVVPARTTRPLQSAENRWYSSNAMPVTAAGKVDKQESHSTPTGAEPDVNALKAIADPAGCACVTGPIRMEPEKLDAVLQAAVAAPSPANLQGWAFVVVTDSTRGRRQIARYLVEVQEHRVFRELLGMPDEYTARLMGLYEEFDRAPCFVFVCLEPKVQFARPEHEAVLRQWHLVSLGAAMQNLMVAATALGLGTRWFGGFNLDNEGDWLTGLLGIPPGVEIVAATPLGYHDEPPKPRPVQELAHVAGFRRGDSRALGRMLKGKLPLGLVVHVDHW
jgi:nitroreductase